MESKTTLMLLTIHFCLCLMDSAGQSTEMRRESGGGDCGGSTYQLHDEITSLRRELVSQNSRLKAQLDAIDQRLRGFTSDQSGGSSDATCRPRDCAELRILGSTQSDVYQIFPKYQWKQNSAHVYCEMNDSETWLVIQRRKDGGVDFEKNWAEYAAGFGDPHGEFWLGNQNLHILTSSKKYKLRIELEDYDGFTRFAEYSTFSVASSAEKYRLTVLGYSGNAGDSLTDHNGQKFSTKDSDNDSSNGNCAEICHSGWWFFNCYDSNLNGRYLRGDHTTSGGGIEWVKWRGNRHSLKSTVMKLSLTG